ncbi:MAG: hypothetical protein JXJ04_14830 [Spirochaetales bacterium]|nr:hypothetical protein [Spirochaetales bacterium]
MRRFIGVCIIVFSIITFLGCGGATDCPECSEPDPTDAPEVDTAPPVVTFVNPGNGDLVSGTLLIAGTAIDASAIQSVEIRIDSDSWETLGTPNNYWTYTVDTFLLTEGNHTAAARSTDVNGYQSSAVTVSFTVDQTVPEIAITNPVHGAILQGNVLMEGTAADENGIKSVIVNPNQADQFIDTGDTSPWDYIFDSTTVADGEIIITALATDNADLYSITNIAVIVDNTPPDVTITSLEDRATVSGIINFSGTADDTQSLDRIMVKVSGGAEDLASGTTTWTYPVDTTLLDPINNPHTLSVIAYDTAGNFTEEQIDIYVDQSPPSIAITDPLPLSYVRGSSVTIQGTVSNMTGTDTMEIDISDGNGFVSIGTFDGTNWSHTIDSSIYGSDGLRTLTLRAQDDTTFAWDEETLDCYIDNTLPTGSIMSPANGSSVAENSNIIITGSASDNMKIDTAVLTINGGTLTPDVTPSLGSHYWSYTWNTTGFTGDVPVYLTVTDKAGNVYTSATSTLTISTESPFGSITLPAQGAIVGGTITISGQAFDSGGTIPGIVSVEYQFDDTDPGSWLPTNLAAPDWTTSPDQNFDTSTLSDGLHDLYVQITDGNGLTALLQISIISDNSLPDISITFPTDANTGDNFLYDLVTITGTASDETLSSVVVEIDGGAHTPVVTGLESWTCDWNTVTYPAAKTGVVIRATATDSAGNTNFAEVTVDIKPMITGLSAESVFINEILTIEGYNFVDDVNTIVRFTSPSGTVDAGTFDVVDDNTIDVTVPSGAISGNIYIVEGTGAVESNRIFVHVWTKNDITGMGDTVEQDLFIDGTDTYHVAYDGGNTKDVRFSKNAGASFQLDTGAGSGIGQKPSIVIDPIGGPNGNTNTNVFVSYINTSLEHLRIRRSFTGGTTWQAIQELSTFEINQDATTSIAYDPVNNVVGIAYQTLAGTLGYISSSDNDTQPGDSWNTPVEIDASVGAGYYSHLAFNSAGRPYIAYYDTTTKKLRLAYYTGVFWTTKVVDTADLQGQYVSMALDSGGGIHLSYYNGQAGDLMYAYAGSTLSSFTISSVDTTGITGYCTDITLDGTTPHIAYIDYSYSELMYAYYTGTKWDLIPVPDSINNITIAKVAIGIDSGGNKYICYGDAGGGHRLLYKE